MIGAVLKNGASPLLTKVAAVILILFLAAVAFLGWKLYVAQDEITTLTEANTQLKANVLTLEANVAQQEEVIEDLVIEIALQRVRFEDLLEAYQNLENKQRMDAERAEAFRKALRELEEDLESEEGKLLNTVLPDNIIDLYNSGNRRLRNLEKNSGGS